MKWRVALWYRRRACNRDGWKREFESPWEQNLSCSFQGLFEEEEEEEEESILGLISDDDEQEDEERKEEAEKEKKKAWL